MLHQNNLVALGKIIKTHGIQGALKIDGDQSIYHSGLKIDRVYLKQGNHELPFIVQKIKQIQKGQLVVKLKEVNNQPVANSFIGKVLFFHADKNKTTLLNIPNNNFPLLDYSVIDIDLGMIGVIKKIEHHKFNDILIIQSDNILQEILIPLVDHMIQSIDHKKKVVNSKLPKGLLEIYNYSPNKKKSEQSN